MYYVYILKSLTIDKYYTGQTRDLDKRINLHNSPEARWTKKYQPWELVHKEVFQTRGDAIKRERYLKRQKI